MNNRCCIISLKYYLGRLIIVVLYFESRGFSQTLMNAEKMQTYVEEDNVRMRREGTGVSVQTG